MSNSSAENRRTGFALEGEAKRFVEKKGYRVVDRNFCVRGGEIDLIAYDKKCCVFIEVKARKSTKFGTPSEYVGKTKQKRLIYAAECYISKYEIDSACRFDVIEILYYEEDGKIEIKNINHIKNAFEV